MTPDTFIALWKGKPLTERQGAQQYFNDLCDLLGVDKPRDPDNYCFERGAKKAAGGQGWADVWKRGYFGWENKKPGLDLDKAYKQLTDYAGHLDNPPLLVVCDRERIIIHTAFTGYPDEPREIRLDDLHDQDQRQILRWVFTDPEKLRPEKSSAAITEEAAREFSAIAERMRARGIEHQRVAHFLVQCLFAMFAEDETLLPGKVFTSLLDHWRAAPEKAAKSIAELFRSMQKRGGGAYGHYDIAWFNGGLFKVIDVPELTGEDIADLHAAALRDWRAIDPTIFGTLFERGLDKEQRVPIGAHYTDTATIRKLIDPLITEPLSAEWAEVKARIAKNPTGRAAKTHYNRFMLRLAEFRILDPACGSGNFLYLSLAALRDIEKRAHVESVELGFPEQMDLATGTQNVLGLEINGFAAELARVTVWIGDIQWCRRNGYRHATNPILRPLTGIVHQDALLTADGAEVEWPKADVIVGNPPFLGGSKKRGALGDDTFEALERRYKGRVPAGADLVCYWFEKARAQIEAGQLQAAGLVATNSIRGGANRKVLERICDSGAIFEAWSDEPWVNEGAAVRVSLVAFGHAGDRTGAKLDGQPVAAIHADLTGQVADTAMVNLTQAQPLSENVGVSFQGSQKIGAFDIPGELARRWLPLPNPHEQPNSQVLKPSWNGLDVTRRPRDGWIIDFGTRMSEDDAALYEAPFGYVVEHVKPERSRNPREAYRRYWWRHGEPRIAMRAALEGLPRYLVTSEVAKHRTFVWLKSAILPDKRLIVIARADDTTFGILHSRFHELWSLRLGATLEDRPCYRPSTCFETFPFPDGLTPADTKHGTETLDSGPIVPVVAPEVADHARAIAEAAHRLNTLRENWLNPPEWIERIPEVVPGYPDRIIAKPGHEGDLKKRTLTNLYNHPPAWLTNAHRALDAAVARAYGWEDYTPDLPDDAILQRLLALNLQRASS
ncbi:class I SAM-dependent DNA methyltransferase [Allochromatium humboldtianum]|uniref:site-specific DNA-methyltransferase (adenine-specific) n=1 Tax=Allochromatium humboldtianum TaxID=504901 RepID=A0A850R429_9GAMM|nr:class I SAM-dependent DNA methyltransferase [Allochromatium humboldtianum]